MAIPWFDYIVLPLLIMMARVVDVSLDTIRVIMVAKGYRNLAPFVGFFQSLIWLITITRIMANLDNWFTYIGYAGGFGLGTWVGMRLEGKLALGYELIKQYNPNAFYTIEDMRFVSSHALLPGSRKIHRLRFRHR